jgi:hypothetical protein
MSSVPVAPVHRSHRNRTGEMRGDCVRDDVKSFWRERLVGHCACPGLFTASLLAANAFKEWFSDLLLHAKVPFERSSRCADAIGANGHASVAIVINPTQRSPAKRRT